MKKLIVLCAILGALGCGGKASTGDGGGGSGGASGTTGGAGTSGGAGTNGGGGTTGGAGTSGGRGGTGGGAATFPCPTTSTSRYCVHGAQYCRISSIAAAGGCETLPAACGANPTCACIPSGACDVCSQSAAGDIQIIIAADCPTP